MLHSIYYKLSALRYRFGLRKLGKACELRFGTRFIGGKYISLDDNVVLSTGAVFAVYPTFEGKDNPVKTDADGGIILRKGVSANRNLTIYCASRVEIDEDVMMGSGILITDNDHGIDPTAPNYRNQPLTTKPVKIGKGCWIGERATVLSGVEIGEHSIVAAGAVVTKSIPPYSIAAGVPARVIKRWDFDTQEWKKA
ncbi:MAG: acyltransferase [Ruminococcaceae bacterium]|nr:acyltransferase [Oscillospiraceae bacterium]